VDLLWLVFPAAVGLFLLRTVMIARRLKAAMRNPSLSDVHGLREAKGHLTAHREHLEAAAASPRIYLAAAKGLGAIPRPRGFGPRAVREPFMEDALPGRRT